MPEPKPDPSDDALGPREQKRRRTRERIAEAGVKLFLADGYEATTLEAIATAAGISRRTFFSYFASKDEILTAWNGRAWDAVLADVLEASPDAAPLDAVRDVLVRHVSRYGAAEMRAIDHLMRSSPTLLASKPAAYVRQEQALFETLCEVWRRPAQRAELQAVAMATVGCIRLAIDTWHRAGGQGKVAGFLVDAFDSLETAIGPARRRADPKGSRR